MLQQTYDEDISPKCIVFQWYKQFKEECLLFSKQGSLSVSANSKTDIMVRLIHAVNVQDHQITMNGCMNLALYT